MDIYICLERLGLAGNSFIISNSVPPHTITSWDGPDPEPTQEELQAAWDAYQAEGGYAKEEAQMNRRVAYKAESDPLFYKWKRGEILKAVWTDKVAEIKARYPY
jgi:hypothetical protein|tara:strand:- start:2388 stop:2699 length:312 start_codon:yes stop_codon:yes gene_type:complete